jgi:nucleotide-binding universal stress UspA family protein
MIPTHTILFPTDLSDRANHVFPLACALARDCGARLVVLYVMPPPLGPDVIEARHRPNEYFGGARKALQRLHAPAGNVCVEHKIEEGNAAEVIVETAKQLQVGLVCMGTHGRTGPGRVLFGSVAEQVMRKSPCPVLTIRTPTDFDLEHAPSTEEPFTGSAPLGTVLWPLRTILHPTDFSKCSADAFG